ncbi:hypothetical protein [Pararobbsia silviterrae]|uniref:Uncharacterized protein n=1 Tax=Pararobbsia silviterrae TaxID=1792498 RepID=A0A494X8J6_9BURK|nr:hypothetical protein [Pararobbsia silviterrae]RKP44696.1 hypothetical protein D7S86_27080 [Pararobbsia silviterrae]
MDDALEFFLERAAIMQYDGGKDLADAEFAALSRTRVYCERMGITQPKTDYFARFRLYRIDWSESEGRGVYVRETVDGKF